MTADLAERVQLVSIGEAAAMVGYSTKTIRRAIATAGRHHLKATKVRGQWRIRTSDLDAWIRSYAVRPVL